MRLKIPQFDGRNWGDADIIDEDSGKKVGRIRCDGTGLSDYVGMEISLFDGKYRTSVNSRQECCGFVKGVESVLNRLTSVDDGRRGLDSELHAAREKMTTFPNRARPP